jgi:predicted ArsR family transcriptional regulator
MLSGLRLQLGYEPSRHDARTVQSRSCPFHPLAAESPQMTCRIHHAHMSGLVEGMGATTVEAILAPGSNETAGAANERVRRRSSESVDDPGGNRT